MTYKITLIEGDGIGPEISAAVKEILKATGLKIDWQIALGGIPAIEKYGEPLPEITLKLIKKNKIALKAPITTPVGKGFRSVNVMLRKHFNLYANVRPVRCFAAKFCHYEGIDLVVMRENTEDLYAGIEHEIVPGVVESVKIITKKASLKIAEYAFDYAVKNKRKKITAIHKANIMKLSDGLFLDCARKVAKKYPKIEFNDMIVDNACMQLVMKPTQFDVLLLENLYGDIVSDLCAGLIGGLGLVPGANIGDKASIFEAVHGSAPDIAGKGLANPIAFILTACLMLKHLGEQKIAMNIEQAVEAVCMKGKVLTRDLGGKASTQEITQAIIDAL